MMKNKLAIILLILCGLICQKSWAQQKYWVSFTVKTTKNFDPYKFFDPKTIENRISAGKPVSDWYDIPVDAAFIQTVTKIADSTGYASRWLNGMAVFATPNEIKQIASLPFVKSTEPMGLFAMPASVKDSGTAEAKKDTSPRSKIAYQFDGLEGNEMAAHGLSGKGIRIAILDVGFKNADKHPAFEYLRSHNGIVLTYDFLHHKEKVYDYGAHGTAVLSCIAGKYKGYNMGLAPDAEFLLARTEREGSEFKDEEDAWVAASEWAEQHGAQMISCSLGYTYQRYFYKDMNGRTSVAARGAAAAARKGILICIAAGNEGEDQWKFVTTPGDCDSVLTVGGYDPITGFHSGFSSYGPTSDGRMKPNVIAASTAWVATPAAYGSEQGTSFATPLVAGFVACVWQDLKSRSNMQIMDTVEKLCSLYPYFDFADGYGIPKAGYLFNGRPKNDSSFTMYEEDGKIKVSISTSYFKDSSQTAEKLKKNYLYAKVMDPDGTLKLYDVIKVNSQSFELVNITNYLAVGRFGPNASINTEDKAALYPKGWNVTVYFDHCIRNYHF